ncbi:hypothetical protein ACRARG_03925 [Pseudooceanicola sp. C21-150M6]|uniref:hypothetical protein n=1 Tax=Pseudooceanicola sp. C21-150M6 TaxID=3434355 RepID=UPI003D7F3E78
MTDRILFSIGDNLERQQVVFIRHDDISALPDRPGLFVLMGRTGPDAGAPVYFGHCGRSLLRQVPYDPGFAQAIRRGPVNFATAFVPGGQEAEDLVTALAITQDAPVNAAAMALAEIDSANALLHAEAQARKIAAQ